MSAQPEIPRTNAVEAGKPDRLLQLQSGRSEGISRAPGNGSPSPRADRPPLDFSALTLQPAAIRMGAEDAADEIVRAQA